jgi:hypothetical protein
MRCNYENRVVMPWFLLHMLSWIETLNWPELGPTWNRDIIFLRRFSSLETCTEWPNKVLVTHNMQLWELGRYPIVTFSFIRSSSNYVYCNFMSWKGLVQETLVHSPWKEESKKLWLENGTCIYSRRYIPNKILKKF